MQTEDRVTRSRNRAPGGVPAKDLRVGDWIFDRQGHRAKILSLRLTAVGVTPPAVVVNTEAYWVRPNGKTRGTKKHDIRYPLRELVQRAVNATP